MIQYNDERPSKSPSSIGPRSASATTRNSAANAVWISAGVRSGWPAVMPRARRSAIVRDSCCSTGR
jgi:hypothetical protein